MVQHISGPGVGLPLPQNLYPSELGGASLDFGSNQVTLSAGDSVPVPPGEWLVGLGNYLILQYLDPINGQWETVAGGAWTNGPVYIWSDGYNVRVANMLCCPIGAVVTNAGGSYVQASTTISVTGGGGSTWAPIVGGQLAVSGGTLVSNGAGYGVAPIAIIPAPPPPQSNANGVGGIQASGYFTIANGTISGFTFTNAGAGYQAGMTITAVANPFDVNLATGITLGTIAFSLALAGSITGAICTNSGAPISNPANITLTVSGVGTNATLTPVLPQVVTTGSVTGGGTGFGTTAALLTTVGGYGPTSTFAQSPETLYLAHRARPAVIGLAVTGTGTVAAQAGTIYDGGYFYSTPTAIVAAGMQSGAAGSQAGPTIALTMGSRPDIAWLQPAA